MTKNEHLQNLAYMGTFLVLLTILPFNVGVYYRSFTMFTMMYVVLALSWNIISGYTGYMAWVQVVFYGVGS